MLKLAAAPSIIQADAIYLTGNLKRGKIAINAK